jgi:hypothetical protein
VFVRAADSRLRHCIIEYADCAGDHKDYYDNDCDPDTPMPSRVYFQAVVALACHLDIEGCVFRNLPDGSATAEGDAIAIISDDPDLPGEASANIRACQFLSIGQGIHTRYAFVLVEDCYFTGHRGDNDDVDLYGESTPPPLILNNLFLNPGHDDMINPTRCSAIIAGNIIAGGDDHGIVLRDRCSPILINNLIYDCASAGIAVQNQCDALLINNTIVNCGRGIRFFDHTGRWGPPYCLSPGSGKATVVNSIVWDCPTTFELADSPYTEDRGSHVTIHHSVVQGGQARFSVSPASTVTWGEGNLESNPLFVDLPGDDLRLSAASPAIDAGTDPTLLAPDLAGLLGQDYDGTPRPLDGLGTGVPAWDIGAYEFLLATADSNGDGIPDGWCQRHGLSPVDPGVAESNPDQDPHTTFQEWEADTDPADPESYFRIMRIAGTDPFTVEFLSSADRRYTLSYTTELSGAPGAATSWSDVPGQVDLPGADGLDVLTDPDTQTPRFYRVSEGLPRILAQPGSKSAQGTKIGRIPDVLESVGDTGPQPEGLPQILAQPGCEEHPGIGRIPDVLESVGDTGPQSEGLPQILAQPGCRAPREPGIPDVLESVGDTGPQSEGLPQILAQPGCRTPREPENP